jgi:3-dehydroquinate dehydratase-2
VKQKAVKKMKKTVRHKKKRGEAVPRKARARILVLHGPNLQLLGQREPQIYGTVTLAQINRELKKIAQAHSVQLTGIQSNSESELLERITKGDTYDFLIINPAAYTHTSVAIRDALLAVKKPVIEVHLSNIYGREEFRKTSLISDVAIGVITGFGKYSYFLALEAALQLLKPSLQSS